MEYFAQNHTFALCAYKTCAYLEECIQSLLRQTVPCRVIIATSTPNDHIRSLAEKYSLPVFINEGKSGIAGDWAFAMNCAETELVTIAHQDDVYAAHYVECMLRCLSVAKDPILFNCNYGELKNGERVFSDKLLRIKRIMCTPMYLFPHSRAMRRLTLAFGNPVICPGVTYLRSIMQQHPFDSEMKSNLDWEKWEELSKLEGSFVYTRAILCWHRIHPDAETSKLVNLNLRGGEDVEMFRKFWPEPVARLLTKVYSRGERTYKNI